MGETYQDRLKRIKSQMSSTEGKAKSAGEKVVSAAKSVANKSGNTDTGSSKKNESYENRIARIKRNRKSIVDENYISSFQKDFESFRSDAQSKYEGLTWSSASSTSDDMLSRATDLRSRANMIQSFLNQNKDKLDEDYYKQMQRSLMEINTASGTTATLFKDKANFYGQFETEKDYTDWKTQTDEYLLH